jgi:hypothetical protein
LNSIIDEIFSSIHLIVDQKINQLRLDKTIQAVIVSHPIITENLYKIIYQGVEYDAFSFKTDLFQVNDSVLVLIPENNFANKKIILSLTNKIPEILI